MTSKLILAPGKERPVLRGHPWIFAGAVQTEPAKTSPGATMLARTPFRAPSSATCRINPPSAAFDES